MMKLWDKLKEALLKLHEWVQQRWLIVSIIISTSSIWFSLILSFYGERFKLIFSDANGNRKLTGLGVVLTVIVVGFSALLVLAQRYYEYVKLNPDNARRKLLVLEHVSREINKICDHKYVTLKKQLWKLKNDERIQYPQIVSNPCEQLKQILEKMGICLCELLVQNEYSIDQDELYVSLFYNFPLEDNDWRQTDRLSPEKGLSVDKLLEQNTTFSKVLESKKPFLFFNSKEQAKKEDCYISDEEDSLDESNSLKGSIACYRMLIKEDDKVLIKAVLSFTTYSKKFVNSEDKKVINNVKYNIEEHILKSFVKRIDIELCLLYLHDLYIKQKTNDMSQDVNLGRLDLNDLQFH